MTKRKMADRKILQLLCLLYDVCKESMEEFFKYKCLGNDPTDYKLTTYLVDHKDKLYKHMKYSICHKCSALNNEDTCVKGSKRLFKSLFILPEDCLMANISSVTLKDITLDNLDIWTLQYLLLAYDLDYNQHKWIRTLYEKRKEVSNVWFETISDDNFNDIWSSIREIILNFVRLLKNPQYEKAVAKQVTFLEITDPPFCSYKSYWCMMQQEFTVDFRPHPDTTIAPCMNHPTKIDENKKNNKKKVTVNVQTDNIFVGDNNKVINSITDPTVKRLIIEILEGQQRESQERQRDRLERQQRESLQRQHERLMVEKVEQLCVITNIKHMTGTEDKPFKTDKHDNGMDTGQGAASRSDETKEHKYYFVEWKIKTSDDADEEELEKIAKSIELERVLDGNVTIKFVRIGSIVIGTIISANAVDNSDFFNQIVRRFIRMIIDKCNVDTSYEHVLEIDVTFKPSVEYTGLSSKKVREEIASPSTEVIKSDGKRTQTYGSESKMSAYVKMFASASALKDSMMSLKVDSIGNQTLYAKVEETEILYAEFPLVKIKALTNYTHTVDKQQVAIMKKDQIYSLIKQVGDWWEITDTPGPSFFVKSEYAVNITPGNALSPVRKPSSRHALSSTAVQKHYSDAIELLGGADSKVPESDYDTIPGDTMDVKARLRKTTSEEQFRHHEHEPLRKAISEALPQHSQMLKRQPAIYYAEHQDSSYISLTPSQKTKAFRKKRAMSFPSLDTHSDPCPEDVAPEENFKSP